MMLPKPTAEQAKLLATMLDAGVIAPDAIDLLAPETEPSIRPELAEAWPQYPSVLRERVALNRGRDWLQMDAAERLAYATQLAYNSMAYAVYRKPVASLDGADLKKHLDFLDRLEKKQAGTAGADDPMAAFIQKFKSKLDKDAKAAAKSEAVN